VILAVFVMVTDHPFLNSQRRLISDYFSAFSFSACKKNEITITIIVCWQWLVIFAWLWLLYVHCVYFISYDRGFGWSPRIVVIVVMIIEKDALEFITSTRHPYGIACLALYSAVIWLI